MPGRGTIGKLLNNSKVKQGAVAAEFDALMNDIQHGHGTLTKLLYDDPLMSADAIAHEAPR